MSSSPASPYPVPEFRLQWVGEPAPLAAQRYPATAAGVAQAWDSLAYAAGYESQFEHAAVFIVGENNTIAGYRLLAKGNGNSVAIVPMEIVLTAVCAGSSAVLIAHTHPSQDATPSEADIEWTQRASVICELAGVRLLDHVIVASQPSDSRKEFASMRERGHFAKFDAEAATKRAFPTTDRLEQLLLSDPDVAVAVFKAAKKQDADFLEFAERSILNLLRAEFPPLP